MSTLLFGVEPANAEYATIDLKHSLRHQAPKRAPKSTIALTVYSLPRTQDALSVFSSLMTDGKQVSSLFWPGPGRVVGSYGRK